MGGMISARLEDSHQQWVLAYNLVKVGMINVKRL